ncbi:MAG: protein SCO1/2 [Myxococcota bacterium]|jgi:protein SCO1/2
MRIVLLGCLLLFASCSEEALDIYDTIGGDFTLNDQYDVEYKLSEHNGKLRILFFGFSYCPDICPSTLGEISAVWSELSPADQQQVEILFLSVDPERDTAELLRNYLDSFGVPVLGLRGSTAQMTKITADYAAFYEKVALDSSLEYTIDHSSQTFVIDRQGRIRGWVAYDEPPSALLSMLRRLL